MRRGSDEHENWYSLSELKGNAVATQYFKPIDEEIIERLIKQGDVMACAGGFVIEQMEEYLEKREGERETIEGLPVTITEELLAMAMKDS